MSQQRRRRTMASVLALATAAALVAVLAITPAPSAAAPVTEQVEAACNNTFSPTKFPLTYKITSTPSADPVAADASFTVQFDVTLVASAGFLNGVYEILGSVAIPIIKNRATIVPLSGATGPAVQANMASTFTIPAPAATPVSAGVEVPIGTVTGTYTATEGTAKFGLVGNSWAPTDSLPAGVTQAGWQGSGGSVALTSTGSQTYAQASLAGGVIKPFLVCMGGTWTPSGDTYTTPLVAQAGFGAVTVQGTSATTSTTTTTTATSSTTTTTSTTTTSTTPTTGTTTSTTMPPPDQTEVTGSARYANECTNDVTDDVYPLTFEVEGTVGTNVRSGDTLTVVDQAWSVTVPGDLLGLVSSIAGTDSVDALVTPAVAGKNTFPAVASPAAVAVSVGPIVSVDGVTQPLTVGFQPGNVQFQATGGNAEFRMGRTILVVELTDELSVTLTCTPVASAEAFVISTVTGPPVAVTTSTSPGGGTNATGGTATGGGSTGGTLARTGSDARALAIQILAGLLLIQLGYLTWSVVAPLRPARARTR